MNKKQKKIIWIGIIIFVAMFLFPPWVSMHEEFRSSLYRNAGYGFLFFPPNNAVWVDLTRLITQWMIVFVLTIWFVYLSKE